MSLLFFNGHLWPEPGQVPAVRGELLSKNPCGLTICVRLHTGGPIFNRVILSGLTFNSLRFGEYYRKLSSTIAKRTPVNLRKWFSFPTSMLSRLFPRFLFFSRKTAVLTTNIFGRMMCPADMPHPQCTQIAVRG